MRTSTFRLFGIAIVFFAALAAALLVLRGDGGSKTGSSGSGGAAAAGDVWKVGDEWVVKVKQDGGAIAPGGAKNVAEIPFRFAVTDAPTGTDGTWTVQVRQDGAEGPFAEGWRLFYAERDDALVLTKVAMGRQDPLEAELATIVLGSQFPYEVRYTAPPKDRTVTASDLIERSTLPPTTKVPGGPGTGDGSKAPTAPPIEDAVAPGAAPAAPKG